MSSDVATNEIPVNSSPNLAEEPAFDPAKEQVPSELALIVFEEEVYDFGTLTEGESVTHIFQFTNGGNVPLTLQKLQRLMRMHSTSMSEGTHHAQKEVKLK